MAWIAIKVQQLTIGHYIKLDHSWIRHPFVRNSFKISSPSEIAIIRKNKLTKIFYDPEKSNTDEQVADVTVEPSPESELEEIEIDKETAEDEQHLQAQKNTQVQSLVSHKAALQQLDKNWEELAGVHESALSLLEKRDPRCLEASAAAIDSLQQAIGDSSAMASLLAPASTANKSRTGHAALSRTALTLLAGKALNLDAEQSRNLGLGAMLSDTGIRKLPEPLRNKLDPLTENERREFERYPELGKEVLVALGNVPEAVIDLVWKHRECLDGSGYPRRLTGSEVPVLARLIGASIEYNGLIAGSAQRDGKSPAAALSTLFTRYKDKLGHDAIIPMILALTVYPPGSFVQLSDGSVGIVVKVNQEARLRPAVLVIEDGNTMAIDLSANRSLAIKEALERGDVQVDLVESLEAAFASGNFGLLDDA